MTSQHTFSATTDCMMSERCSEITSCHLSGGPGLLMLTRSNLAHTRVPASRQRRAATRKQDPKHENSPAHALRLQGGKKARGLPMHSERSCCLPLREQARLAAARADVRLGGQGEHRMRAARAGSSEPHR